MLHGHLTTSVLVETCVLHICMVEKNPSGGQRRTLVHKDFPNTDPKNLVGMPLASDVGGLILAGMRASTGADFMLVALHKPVPRSSTRSSSVLRVDMTLVVDTSAAMFLSCIWILPAVYIRTYHANLSQ